MINFDVGRSVSESSPSHYPGGVNNLGGVGYHTGNRRDRVVTESQNQFHTEDDDVDDEEEEEEDDDDDDEEKEEEDENVEDEDEDNGTMSGLRPGTRLDPTNVLLSSDSGDRDINESLRAFGAMSMDFVATAATARGDVGVGVIDVDEPYNLHAPPRDFFNLHVSPIGPGVLGEGRGHTVIDQFNADPYQIGIPSSSSSSSSSSSTDITQSLIDVSLTGGPSLYPPSSSTARTNLR